MKKLIICCVALLLASCTKFIDHNSRHPFPSSEPIIITLHQLKGGNSDILGYVEIQGNSCKIFLRTYPRCLQHEIRHCYEGNWHEGRDTSADC